MFSKSTKPLNLFSMLLQESVGTVDLKICVTEEVGQIPRDDCARPNTIQVMTVHRQRKGETDSLVATCLNGVVTTKYVKFYYVGI